MLRKVEGRSTFLATRNATITVARKIASCNITFKETRFSLKSIVSSNYSYRNCELLNHSFHSMDTLCAMPYQKGIILFL